MSHKLVLASRLDGVSESATLRLNARAVALKSEGKDIVNLTAGEPDFFVPEFVKDAVRNALDKNMSRYTPVAGVPELREKVAAKTNAQQPGLASPWKGANVLVSNGGKQAIFNAFFALLNPGDEILLPAPYWLSYPEMARLCGATSHFIETSEATRYRITPELLEKAIREKPKAKILVLNSPSNPTGQMYSEAELAALGRVIEKQAPDLWVLSDEIYDQIVFGKVPFTSFGKACPFLQERLITVNGLSKSSAMTGWRIGWTVAPLGLTQAMSTIQGQVSSGISSLTQQAGIKALDLGEEFFADIRDSFRKRAASALEILGSTGKIKVVPPEGAFYLWADFHEEDATKLAEELLEKAFVATVPGAPFGAASHLRLSIAVDIKTLEEGCRRISKFMSSR